ncbi:hypothetical protein WDJ51_03510 [Rathayibacter sp. YIM 133350]|uniref:hypothetical protein n=1 Tax=Rathayibacter sp. YIM 133350 TaxID=3131992 RepID=UPI00307DBD5B
MTDLEVPLSTGKTYASVTPIWLLALVGSVLAGTLAAPDAVYGWLCLSLAACTIVAFCVQLAVRRREGFVRRVTLSIVGAVIATALVSIVIALLNTF